VGENEQILRVSLARCNGDDFWFVIEETKRGNFGIFVDEFLRCFEVRLFKGM
jgi:hypothetical protein